jgi:mannosyltransferase
VVFCLPAAALLAGTGLAALGRVAGPAGLAAIVVTALPAQASVRAPDGHGQNLRAISHFLGAHARRGDPVLFAGRYIRKIEIAYPAGYRGLRDISLGESAVQAGQPESMSVPPAVLRQRLLTVTRLWVIATTRNRAFLPPGLSLRLVRHWDFAGGYRVRLYVRPPASGR